MHFRTNFSVLQATKGTVRNEKVIHFSIGIRGETTAPLRRQKLLVAYFTDQMIKERYKKTPVGSRIRLKYFYGLYGFVLVKFCYVFSKTIFLKIQLVWHIYGVQESKLYEFKSIRNA